MEKTFNSSKLSNFDDSELLVKLKKSGLETIRLEGKILKIGSNKLQIVKLRPTTHTFEVEAKNLVLPNLKFTAETSKSRLIVVSKTVDFFYFLGVKIL